MYERININIGILIAASTATVIENDSIVIQQCRGIAEHIFSHFFQKRN